MKSNVCFSGIWRNLKKRTALFSAGILLALPSFSNPIIAPPMITEIHFDAEGNWSIELCIWEFSGTLDDFRLTGLYDTAQFVPGITFSEGQPLVVTQDDFQTNMTVEQSGDCLNLETFDGTGWNTIDYFGLRFGNVPYPHFSYVSAPAGEESIAWQGYIMYGGAVDYWAVKELPNTLGYSQLDVHKRAAFSGYVKDRNGDPLPDIYVDYCNIIYPTWPAIPQVWTGQDGYFHTDSMFCRKYFVFFMHEGHAIGDTVIHIEPDSANYFEFTLDTLLTGVTEIRRESSQYSVRIIPNPFSGQTKFVIESSHPRQNEQGIIKIYNTKGIIVDILPVRITGEFNELVYHSSEKGLASGVYYYNLEIAGNRKASGKMIIGQ